MLEKKYLKMNSVLTFEHSDVKEYADQITSGGYPDNLPKTTKFDIFKKELKGEVEVMPDGRILIYKFYAVGEGDFLVLSRLGISVLTRAELAAVTTD